MDTKHLEYIIAIADEKNMTKAAEKLYVSQSSLSYYLAKLEHELGTPLFIRGGGGYNFTPTPAGEMYIAASRQVLEIKKELYKNIAMIHDQESISIAATSQWGTNAIIKVMPQFERSFPDIAFQLEAPMGLPDILQQIDNEKLDMALAAIPSRDWLGDKRKTLFLCEEELTVALPLSHPYIAEHPGQTMEETDMIRLFSQETILLSKKRTANRTLIDGIFDKHHAVLPSQSLREITGIKTTVDLVSRDLGIGILPVSVLDPNAPMKIYSLDPPVFRYNVILFRKHLPVSPARQILVRYIQSCIPKRWVYGPDPDEPPS